MPEAISTPPGRHLITIVLLAVFLVLVIGILFIGLNDAPEYILGYLATTVLFFIFIRRWRKIKSFIILFAVTLFCILFLSLLYVEVVCRLAEWIGGITALNSAPMAIITMVITYVILFGGPVGMFAGIAGAATLGIFRLISHRNRKKTADNT
jgi:hypothetical protein